MATIEERNKTKKKRECSCALTGAMPPPAKFGRASSRRRAPLKSCCVSSIHQFSVTVLHKLERASERARVQHWDTFELEGERRERETCDSPGRLDPPCVCAGQSSLSPSIWSWHARRWRNPRVSTEEYLDVGIIQMPNVKVLHTRTRESRYTARTDLSLSLGWLFGAAAAAAAHHIK